MLARVYVAANRGTQVPLSERGTLREASSRRLIKPSGAFSRPVPISFGSCSYWSRAGDGPIRACGAAMHVARSRASTGFCPATQGLFGRPSGASLLILAALVCAVYIIPGRSVRTGPMPLTIISTLPYRGLGALLALQAYGAAGR